MKLGRLPPRVQILDHRTAKALPGTERIRGSSLQSIRKRVLARDQYLCQSCLSEGRHTLATEVDHRTPLFMGGAETDSNRWSLCQPCHSGKSAQEEAERRGGSSLKGF